MTQTDLNVANAAGAAVRADINDHLEALATCSSGATAPSVTFPNQWWFDTSTNLLKSRNNANTAWVTVAAKDGSGWRPYYNGSQIDSVFLLAINNLTAETAPAVGDLIGLYDASAAAYRKMSLQNALRVINNLTADASPDSAADYVLSYDASAAAVKKVLMGNLPGIEAWQESFTTATTALSATIPLDATAPLVSEGTEIASIGGVTVASGQKVELQVDVTAYTADPPLITALFRDSSCIAARVGNQYSAPDTGFAFGFSHVDNSGAGTYTYSLRVGPATGTGRLNSLDGAGQLFATSCLKSGMRLRRVTA